LRRTVFSHPDFLEAIAGCQPSAPAWDRICWPSDDTGSARGLVPEGTYRRWGIAPRPEDVVVVVCRRTGAPSL